MIQSGLRKIVLVNDLLTGSMGEKVLWDYLLNNIPNIVGVDKKLSDSCYAEYINKNHVDAKIIIQNASFLPLIDSDRFTISFLQDNFRAMGKPSPLQEGVLKHSNMIVSNSKLTALSYPEYAIKIIPIGVDDELFSPQNTNKKKVTGIFIGALDEIKGWPEIKAIIDQRSTIDWIVVSKDSRRYEKENVTMYNRIDQKLLSELINSANFFIVGSPVETQCLSAIESCMCDIPVVMHNTGIFSDFSESDKRKVGYIGSDLSVGIDRVLSKKYFPRNIMKKYGLTIPSMLKKWKTLLKEVSV